MGRTFANFRIANNAFYIKVTAKDYVVSQCFYLHICADYCVVYHTLKIHLLNNSNYWLNNLDLVGKVSIWDEARVYTAGKMLFFCPWVTKFTLRLFRKV